MAFRERFDELASHLLDSLPHGLRDDEVRRARVVLAWRAGRRGLGELGPQPELTQAEAEALIDAACECCLPDEALALLAGPCSALVQQPLGARLQQALSTVGRVDEPASPAAVVVSLPDGGRPFAGAGGRPAWPLCRPDTPGHQGFLRRGATWVTRRLRRLAKGGPLATCTAAEATLPQLPASTVVLVPSGVLDRFTARHWTALLEASSKVVISGLQAHDPGAMTPVLRQALLRHAPIGAADMTSALVLREWGVYAVVDRGDRPLPAPDTLWQFVPPGAPDAGWWPHVLEAWESGSRVQAMDVLMWRREWLAGCPREAESSADLPAPTFDFDALAGVSSRSVTSFSAGSDAVEVALAVDERLAAYAAVVIESCLERASTPLRFHILGRGVTSDTMQDWRRLFDHRAEIHLHRLDQVQYGDRLRLLAHTTISTLDRLVLPLLLPHVDRVIYLDVDLVVMDDVTLLWRTDMRGRPLAAKPSSSPGNRWGLQMLYQALSRLPLESALSVRAWLHRSGPMLFRAFNAGVLLMDLQRMRSDGATSRLLALVEHCGMNDQDALNAYVRGGYQPLDDSWNAAPRQDVTTAARIIHFVGPVKPWHDTYISRKPEFEHIHDRVLSRRPH
ncbi:MAG: glycosyltransferase family 8 protein [Pseudomonadota bacterium]